MSLTLSRRHLMRSRSLPLALPASELGPEAIGVWVGTRLGLTVLTLFAALLTGYLGHARGVGWAQWDTEWYLRIAREGYAIPQSANFFPLYPALIWLLSGVAAAGSHGGDGARLAAALGLSSLAALVAFWGVGWLGLRDGGSRAAAITSLRLLAAYPLAFFLFAGYTEALFLALAVLAFAAVWQRAFGWAAACLFAAALLRPSAVILFVPVVYELGRSHGWRLPREPRALLAGAAALLAIPVGLGAYMAMLALRFRDPLLFLHTQQQYWHHRVMAPWSTARLVAQHLHGGGGLEPLDVGLFLAFAAATVLMVGRLPLAYVLYMAGLLVLTIASPQPAQHDVIASAGRYLLAGFPVFLLVGRWVVERPWLEMPLLATGFMLQAGLAFTFLVGGPVY